MKLLNSLKESKRWLYAIVLVACMGISTYQLVECISKLRHPPVSTHYRFVINDTLHYPAVTICRNPSYKNDVLQQYNLGSASSNVVHTSEWSKFSFKDFNLNDVWNNITYSLEEVVRIAGLHGSQENVKVIENYFLFFGRCFTFIPKAGSQLIWPNSGWSFLLRHSKRHNYNIPNERLGLVWDTDVDGYHIFIHEPREPYTENYVQTQYISQYLYMDVGEELEVRLTAEEYKGISSKKRPCTTNINYSRYKCMELNRWKKLADRAKCIAPWMTEIDGYPLCNTFEQMKQLLNEYTSFDESDDKDCTYACNMSVYKLFIVKRIEIKSPYSQLYVYYSSKLVTSMEELPGYDQNDFLADLGGSLGFFLGLSVIGIIGIIDKSVKVIFCYAKPMLKDEKKEEDLEETKMSEKY